MWHSVMQQNPLASPEVPAKVRIRHVERPDKRKGRKAKEDSQGQEANCVVAPKRFEAIFDACTSSEGCSRRRNGVIHHSGLSVPIGNPTVAARPATLWAAAKARGQLSQSTATVLIPLGLPPQLFPELQIFWLLSLL